MIDWHRVETLREEVGEDSFDDVVNLFLQEVDDIVARFLQAPDPRRLEADLHFLKGSALNLGFDQLGALCQAGEHLAAQGRGAEVDLPAIVALFADSRRLFLTTLGRAAA